MAKPLENRTLTDISFKSKGHWNYPSKYFEIWKNELTISKEYISENKVYVFEKNSSVIGYYSIVNLKQDIEVKNITIKKGFWLEHMFVLPKFLGQRIGTKMVNHLKQVCEEMGISLLSVLADPNSKGFYEKMGFEYKKEYPSTIPGRTTPLLQIKIKNARAGA